jgi:hypothetical protein
MTYNIHTKTTKQYNTLIISTQSSTIDSVLKDIETLPQVIDFLKDSTLGFEYITIEFNHGQDLTITLYKYI